jgi:hypothetical protein
MKKKAILKVVLIVAVLGLIFLGVGGYFGYQMLLKPSLAYNKAYNAVKDFETADFDLAIEYDMEFSDLDMTMNMVMDGEGKVDVEEEALEMDLETSLMGESVMISEVIKNDDIYLKIDDQPWRKTSISEVMAESGMSIEDVESYQTWGNLENPEMSYVGEEEIAGKKYFKYEITISDEMMDEMLADMMKGMTEGAEGLQVEDATIEEISMNVWVDSKTSMPYKEEVEIKKAEVTGDPTVGDFVFDVVLEMTYKNVNEPVTIEVPEV